MRLSLIRLILLSSLLAAGCVGVLAQGADNGSLFPKQDDKDAPVGFKEMLKKLEIDRQKKDFEEMQARGKQALELSSELEKSTAGRERFTEAERAKLETLEKLVKRIRRELGGSDDDEMEIDSKPAAAVERPSSIADGFRSLKEVTVKLVDELQKTTRFTVSTAAIRSSNAVLRMAKFLRFWK